MGKTARVRVASRDRLLPRLCIRWLWRPAGLQLFFAYVQHTQFTVSQSPKRLLLCRWYRQISGPRAPNQLIIIMSWLGHLLISSLPFFIRWPPGETEFLCRNRTRSESLKRNLWRCQGLRYRWLVFSAQLPVIYRLIISLVLCFVK